MLSHFVGRSELRLDLYLAPVSQDPRPTEIVRSLKNPINSSRRHPPVLRPTLMPRKRPFHERRSLGYTTPPSAPATRNTALARDHPASSRRSPPAHRGQPKTSIELRKCHRHPERPRSAGTTPARAAPERTSRDAAFTRPASVDSSPKPRPCNARCPSTDAPLRPDTSRNAPARSSKRTRCHVPALTRIAARGHVFSFVPDAHNLVGHGPKSPPQQLGVNRASTFTGFCSKHDNAIFAALEKTPFAGTPSSAFSWRTARWPGNCTSSSRPSSTGMPVSASNRPSTSPHRSPGSPSMPSSEGPARASPDVASHKADYDRILLRGHYRDGRAHVVDLSRPPSVRCTDGIVPEHTFDGEKLIDIPNHPQRLSTGTLTASPVRFCFECAENVHLQPSWWQGLSARARDRLVARMDASSEFVPRDRARDFHSDDGVTYGRWDIVRRYDVGAWGTARRRQPNPRLPDDAAP